MKLGPFEKAGFSCFVPRLLFRRIRRAGIPVLQFRSLPISATQCGKWIPAHLALSGLLPASPRLPLERTEETILQLLMQAQYDPVQEKLKTLSSSALELMILPCTILFPLITWACIFFLFSNALGMLLPLWDSNEYIPISKCHWMQWRLQCFFFSLSCQPSVFPCSVSSSAKAPGERRKSKTRMLMEETGPYCTRWKYLGICCGGGDSACSPCHWKLVILSASEECMMGWRLRVCDLLSLDQVYK